VAALDRAAAEASARDIEQVQEAARRSIPAGRYGEPAEFGATVAFLCSQQAAYITGASIPVDGGAVSGHW
jgi:3-oxoacyl-[acyl-carrier protein] reductase